MSIITVLEMCLGESYGFFNNSFMFEDAVRFLRLVKKGENARDRIYENK